MDAQEFLQYFLITLGGSGVLLLAVGFLCRSLILNLLAKDLGKYKEELRRTTELEVQATGHRLEIAKLEHEVCFSKLHQERFECLKNLSNMAGDLSRALMHVISPGKELDKRTEDALNAIRACDDYLRTMEIFLPKDFAEKWNKKLDEAAIAVLNFQAAAAQRTGDWKADFENGKEAVRSLIEVAAAFRGELLQQGRSLLEKN